MALISWNDSYSVKVKEIDMQHQKLISLINSLNDAMKSRKSKDVMEMIIQELVNYTQYHFQTEENYFKQTHYPGTQEHEKEHNNFVKQVAEFQEQFKNGKALVSVELMMFLKKWLTQHIKGTDQKYTEFFHQHGIN